MPLKLEILQKYKTDSSIFVETGSHAGDGIDIAIRSGYSKIISIEIADIYYNHCKNRFRDNPNVILIKGDSEFLLKNIIEEYDIEKLTFWLDGHYSHGNTGRGKQDTPLLYELDTIKNSKRNDHIILIDDMRCWKETDENYKFGEKDILEKLNKINNYKYAYEDGHIIKDILVAYT